MVTPWQRLFRSRKFWLLILDAVVSSVTLVLNKVLSPADMDFALKLIAIYQPIFIFLISSIAYENSKIVPAQYDLESNKEWNASALERSKIELETSKNNPSV